ncbi:zinc finger protein 229-like isoform X3 [Girardinichthys multiradiatus]|uniref:zinc finger protein 229-like isoform X3 n=1 Tax=Girardinichthys multiradiatus TaxID=208333 RepID=UPI001FADE6DA|nr:zinc finger protein 229-like isoform X3 [Girardinichthys multiradiatus]
MKSNLRTPAEEECTLEQSTSSDAAEDLHHTSKSAPYQTYSSERTHPKVASANLNNRTLHLTVRLQTGQKEDEQEPVEEIGGLINSDGEVVAWDERDNSDEDCAEVSHSEKEVILVDSQLQDQRDCSSPTLIMEVVGEDEENEEGEQEKGVVKMTRILPLHSARTRRRRLKKVRVQSLEHPDKGEHVPLNAARRRVRRQISQTSLLCGVDSDTNEGVSRRSRRRRNICTYAEPEEINSETIPCVTVKQPYQKKDAKHSAEGENKSVLTGRKDAVDFEDEGNPSPSELSEYLKSLPGESKIRSSLHCLECGKDCESQSALQAHHVTTHSQATAGPETAEHSASQFVFCHRCSIQFDDKEKLEEHMKTHIKEKRYSCPDCGKRFINESYIQIHQRIHTGERPFLCSLCGRGFHTASSLKLHEMQHSGEKPYACSICGKTFQINSYLNAHYQTHIKDRPFICSVCGKGYSRAEELKVHHRLHTGERPYKCGECEKSFIYRQGLRQHQRTHAGRRIGPTRQLGRPKQQSKLEI